MNKIWARAAWASLALFVFGAMEAHAMPLMKWPDLLSRPRPAGSERIAYGTDPNQFGDLWRPVGSGLHPLVIMIHGGCWEASVADLSIMDWAADDLRQRGYVVWNIEYRRIDQPGGGYPGTYEDVEAAIRFAETDARFDPHGEHRKVILLGHSAGGHLALWAANNPNHRIGRLYGVAALGAITDLEHDTETACGAEAPSKMLGLRSAQRPRPADDTSPFQMISPDVERAVLITGAEDTTVSSASAVRYAALATAVSGDDTRAVVLTPPGGHVEEISPGSLAWAVVVVQIERLMKAR
jgi:acetyl esterase/lipase